MDLSSKVLEGLSERLLSHLLLLDSRNERPTSLPLRLIKTILSLPTFKLESTNFTMLVSWVLELRYVLHQPREQSNVVVDERVHRSLFSMMESITPIRF